MTFTPETSSRTARSFLSAALAALAIGATAIPLLHLDAAQAALFAAADTLATTAVTFGLNLLEDLGKLPRLSRETPVGIFDEVARAVELALEQTTSRQVNVDQLVQRIVAGLKASGVGPPVA